MPDRIEVEVARADSIPVEMRLTFAQPVTYWTMAFRVWQPVRYAWVRKGRRKTRRLPGRRPLTAAEVEAFMETFRNG